MASFTPPPTPRLSDSSAGDFFVNFAPSAFFLYDGGAMTSGTKKRGALPAQVIRRLIDARMILNARPENVRPSSLDLSLSDEVYEVEGIFQPRPGETIRSLLGEVKSAPYDWQEPLVRGRMYLARLNERLLLPETVYAACNPKSTSGRLDVHVRLLADGVSRYDSVTPAGWSGELWAAIVSKTFRIKLAAGLSLNQIRFFNADTRLNELELEIALKQYELLWRDGRPLAYGDLKIRDNDGSLILTLDLSAETIGYRARPATLDLTKPRFYEPEQFFEPLKRAAGHLHLARDEFYILSTAEAIRVPPELACEMVPMDEKSGEFRSHYAGFIDPGWGWGRTGEGRGRPLTLEMRPFEDLIVRPGQPIGKIKFELMALLPDVVYDGLDSNYLTQAGPRLSKHFK